MSTTTQGTNKVVVGVGMGGRAFDIGSGRGDATETSLVNGPIPWSGFPSNSMTEASTLGSERPTTGLRKSLFELSMASSTLGCHQDAPVVTTPSSLGNTPTLTEHVSGSGGVDATMAFRSTDYVKEAAAHKILSSQGIDSSTLTSDLCELEKCSNEAESAITNYNGMDSHSDTTMQDPCSFSPSYPSEDPSFGQMPLEQYMQQRQERVIQNILETERMQTKRCSEERLRDCISQDWMKQKQLILNSVIAGRTLGGANREGSAHVGSTDNGMTSISTLPPMIPREEMDGDDVKFHLNFVREKSVTLDRLFTLLQSRVTEGIINITIDNERGGQRAYLNATRLLRTIVKRGPHDENNIEQMALGTLLFLSEQFRSFIVDRVKDAFVQIGSDSASVTGGGSFAANVKKYVQLELGKNPLMEDGTAMWRCIYYCLRCGDSCAAQEILSVSRNIDPVISRAVANLALRQSRGHSIFRVSSALERVNPDNLKEISDLYKGTKTRFMNENQHGIDDYQVACLALLGLDEPLTCSGTNVVNTIEDYIYVTLWFAVQRENGPISCAESISELGKMVKRLGPSHFHVGDASAVGWAYAMPLLLSLQFQSALIHLANVGGMDGLRFATHLGLALMGSRDIIEDWSMAGTKSSSVGETNRMSGVEMLTQFLVAYASTLQGNSPDAALEYLVRIPDDDKQVDSVGKVAKQHICRLIVETRAFEVFAGRVSADGSRDVTDESALDKHFDPSQVSDILASAAQEIFHKGNIVDAVELLALAGHYGSLLSVLNRELVQLLIIEDAAKDDRRTYWRDAAMRFHSQYLAMGKTHVINVLEKEGNASLGHTFQLLLNLMVFFGHCREHEWESAWQLIDQLNLFPRDDTEISNKVESFHSLDIEIKQIFHHIILNAMESLYQQHSLLKGNVSVNPGSTQQRIMELRVSARLLVTFSSLIHLNFSGDTKSRITQMEACMV